MTDETASRSASVAPMPHDDLLGKWNALTLALGEELSEHNRVWKLVHAVADVIVGDRNAARSSTRAPFIDPHEEYDGWGEAEQAKELLREIRQMTDNPGIQRKIADFLSASPSAITSPEEKKHG